MDPILDHIDRALRDKGLSDAAASKLAVGNYSLIKNMRSARSEDKRYNFQALERLAQVLELECYFGPRRMPPTEPVVMDAEAYAQVPVLDAWLAAGSGHLNGDAEIIGHLAFRRDWLTKIGISPGHARVARAKGDSMAPGIGNGDLVLIDTAKTLADVPTRAAKDRRSTPVYAFIQAGEARIKRLQRPADRSLLILSDNPAYEPEVIDPSDREFELLGQVVWSGHVWR